MSQKTFQDICYEYPKTPPSKTGKQINISGIQILEVPEHIDTLSNLLEHIQAMNFVNVTRAEAEAYFLRHNSNTPVSHDTEYYALRDLKAGRNGNFHTVGMIKDVDEEKSWSVYKYTFKMNDELSTYGTMKIIVRKKPQTFLQIQKSLSD